MAKRPLPVPTLATTWRATQARAWPAARLKRDVVGWLAGVDVELVDLEVGELSEPHEASVSQDDLGGAALARPDAVAFD